MVINTVINLNGRWQRMTGSDTPRRAKISVSGSSITIDMSDFGGLTAFGMILDEHTITVTFRTKSGQTETLTGKLEKPDIINWIIPKTFPWKKDIKSEIISKVAGRLEQNFGFWDPTGQGTPRAKISVVSSSITIDMSEFRRPPARGSINDDGSITVIFPGDSRTFTGNVERDTIRWSDGQVWKTMFVEG